jgi:hypothetical protein
MTGAESFTGLSWTAPTRFVPARSGNETLTGNWDYGKNQFCEDSLVKQDGGNCLRVFRKPKPWPGATTEFAVQRPRWKAARQACEARHSWETQEARAESSSDRGVIQAEELMLKSWEEFK